MFDFSSFNVAWARWQFNSGAAVRRRIWIKLAKLIGNGVKIIDGVQSIRERRQAQYGKTDPAVMALLAWEKQLKNGKKFSEAIALWVPSQERMLLAAGERSGKLGESMESAAEVMVAQRDIKSAIIGGLAYPALLVVAGFGMLFMFGYKLIPAFSQVVSDDKWKGMAAIVVSISHWVQSWLWLPGMMFLLSIGALIWAMPNWVGEARVRFDRYPPFSIYRVVQGSSWIISLAAMVEAGERLEDALKQIVQSASPWLSARTNGILRGLRGGHSLGEAMARTRTGFPDPEIIDDMAIYSQMADLDEALKMISREWIKDSVTAIQTNMKVVFNVGLVAVACLIGFMVTGLISMQMQMGQIMQHGAR